MEFPLRPWNDLDIMSLRELCGAWTAHNACAHKPNASPTPPQFEFEVRRSGINRAVIIYRDTAVYVCRDTQFGKR